MATRQTCLDIGDLVDVLDLLKRCGFQGENWYELGLWLGLKKSTLDVIEKNHPHDVSRCMTECLSQWLGRADNVDSRGGANLNSLSDALGSMNETAVAEKLKHQVLINIFNNRHIVLSQSLCDPVAIAWLLYAECMLTQEAVRRVLSASPSIPNQREALLTGVKEAVQTDPNSLHTFANVLCTISTNVSLGQTILDDISKYFPTPEVVAVPETIIISQVRSPVPKHFLKKFISMKASYRRTLYDVNKFLKRNVDVDDVKEFLFCYSTSLIKKVEQCSDISSILRHVTDECSLTNIELLHSIVEELEVAEAKECIRHYKIELKEFYKSVIPHFQSETSTFFFDWKPEEHLLEEITEILSEAVGKLVKLKYISESGLVDITKHKNKETSLRVSTGTLNKWLKEGSVDLTVTRVNMLGAPGSGKTCTQLLLLDEDPPTEQVTDSTPIACPTVRAIRVAVNDENKKWKRVDRDELLERLATDLNEVSQEKREEIVTRSASATETVTVTPVDTGHTPASPSLASNEKPAHEPQHASPEPIEEEVDFHAHEVIQKILAKIPKGVNLKDQNWLYVIDCGGQPAYQELLPLFTRAASLNIITLNLSKPLDKKFDMMYRIDGKYFSCCSKSTQLASFQSTVSTAANFKSLDIPSVTKQHGNSMHLVLGTHYDKVDETTLHECEDSLKTSMSSLQPYLRDRIICNSKKSENSVIFPVNTVAKSEERAKYSREICKAVWVHGSDASLTIKIPIRWFAFELSLPEKSMISFKEALSIGKEYSMNEEDTKQALLYFHDVSLMLYYPDVTDVVFVDPKPILNILSQLLALTYVNDDSALNSILLHNHRLSQTVINHLKDGFFNEKLFTHLKSNIEIFSRPEFQLYDLISLLLNLNIITKVEDNRKGKYFIPYALSSYQGSAIPTLKVSNIQPLLIIWRDNKICDSLLPVPQGLFPLVMMDLLNQKDFETKLHPRQDQFRDAMSIIITFNQIPHTLHLINCYTHIEVSFNGPQEHCPVIRNLIMKAIGKVTDDLHLRHNYVPAFNYVKDQEKCYCIVVDKEQCIVNCAHCYESYIIEGNDYWCWFKDSTSEVNSQFACSTGPITELAKVSATTIMRKHGRSEDFESTEIQFPIKKKVKTGAETLEGSKQSTELDVGHLVDVRDLLKKHKYSGVNYYDLGLRLGLLPCTLKIIKEENKDNVRSGLRECLTAWLEQKDDVKSRGGPTYDALIQALRDEEENTVADGIERELREK